jgi:ABC-2 type transport system ATP-binding protein
MREGGYVKESQAGQPVIALERLRKEFPRTGGGPSIALDGLDLQVPEGGVFAFLGPNGAGKTTTLRCLLGLVHATSGQIRVLGSSVPDGLHEVIGDIGSLLETPTFQPRLGGRDNLLLLARLSKRHENEVDRALERVGLTSKGVDKVATYSLGMRQRLGLAAALLKDPRLLILDEPMNGLDPSGLVFIRDLMRSLADEGRTVLMSSHLLSEVTLVADMVAIVRAGRCVYSGTMDALLQGHDPASVFVRIDDSTSAASVLQGFGFDVEERDGLLMVRGALEASDIGEKLASRGLFPNELGVVQPDLESVFLELTSEETGVR